MTAAEIIALHVEIERLRAVLAERDASIAHLDTKLDDALDEIERLRKQLQPMVPVAIKRIIEEVKVDKNKPFGGYNRTYHRHNR